MCARVCMRELYEFVCMYMCMCLCVCVTHFGICLLHLLLMVVRGFFFEKYAKVVTELGNFK